MSDAVTRLNTALEGRYQIERELGEGGMATVYLADDLRHERKVALKVLKPALAAVVGAERFLAEIKTTANLQHPHILPLHDSGEADSFLYYVMPYVEGESLRDRLERDKQLPVDEAIRIATDVAEALHSAHKQGVIHRDIKPANILLSEGRPLVADFGIALAVSAAGGGRLTETGLSMGTPHYMSPEQATGDQHVGPTTDVYALGCVLYEMLVGEPPYTGSTAQAVLGKIIAGDPDVVTAHRKAVPANVDAAVRKALEKLPADRFTGTQELASALHDPGFRHGVESAVAAAPRRSRWSPLAAALGALALVFASGLGWLLARPSPSEVPMRQVLSTEGWAGLGTELGRYAALAPDGSSMILPLDDQLGLKLRGSTEITPIPGTAGARDVVYSPDGQWIAYAIDVELFKRPLVGGSALRVAEDTETDPNRVGMAWLDDGTIIYESTGGTLKLIPEEGGEPLAVLDLNIGLFIWVEGLPGARGALVINTINELHTVDLPDGSSNLIVEEAVRAWYAPTGHLVYVRTDGAVFAVPFDLDGLVTTGGAIPLFDGVRTVFNRADMRLASDGTVLYVEGAALRLSGDRHQLFVLDLEGNDEPLALDPRPIQSVGWSPDGRSVVYSSAGQVYTYDVALGTTPRQLTFEGTNIFPVFSPDATRVAFSSTRSGANGMDLFLKDLDDDAPPRSIITLEANQFVTQWPSDSLIVFERGEGGNGDLWTVDLSDPDNPRAEAYLSSEANLRYMIVSPDGTLAAYRSNESGQNEVYIRSFPEPGALTIVSEGGGDVPFWSPNGETLYYSSLSLGGLTAARIERDPVPVVVSRTFLLTINLSVRPFQGSALHPDGDRFIFARLAAGASVDEGVPTPERLILVQGFFEELRQRAGGN